MTAYRADASPVGEWRLDTVHLGRRVLLFDRLDSTNNYAATLAADPLNEGLVILANEQTAGRGQQGRVWRSPAGAGIWLSVILFPPAPLRRPVILAAWAANSVCETIQTCTGLASEIKWPNDVLIKGRKVSGILIEQGRGTVAGIGLNLNQQAGDFLEQALPLATSLAQNAERSFCRDQVARVLIAHLDKQYQLLHRGDYGTLEASWVRRTDLLGRRVRLEYGETSYEGCLRKLGFDALELQRDTNETIRLIPERVKHIIAI